MKKPFVLLIAFLLATPIFVAAQSLAGDWKITVSNPSGETTDIKLSIASSNTYEVDFGIDGTIEIKGKMTLDGDKMTIQDTEGENACLGEANIGVYSYKVTATSLQMTKITDNCEGRGNGEAMSFTKL